MESGWKAAIRNCRDRKVFTVAQNRAGGRDRTIHPVSRLGRSRQAAPPPQAARPKVGREPPDRRVAASAVGMTSRDAQGCAICGQLLAGRSGARRSPAMDRVNLARPTPTGEGKTVPRSLIAIAPARADRGARPFGAAPAPARRRFAGARAARAGRRRGRRALWRRAAVIPADTSSPTARSYPERRRGRHPRRRQYRRPAGAGRLALSFRRDESGARLRPRGGAGHAPRHRIGTAVRFEPPGRPAKCAGVNLRRRPRRRRLPRRGDGAARMSVEHYSGSCQCGAVAFEVARSRWSATARAAAVLGSRLGLRAAREPRLLRGEDDLTEYLFNKHVIRHLFCKTLHAFRLRRDARRHPDGGDQRQLPEGVDPLALPTTFFDGRSA